MGAIDCSSEMNVEICRDYNVQAYPSIKVSDRCWYSVIVSTILILIPLSVTALPQMNRFRLESTQNINFFNASFCFLSLSLVMTPTLLY